MADPDEQRVLDWLRSTVVDIGHMLPGHGFADLAPLEGVSGVPDHRLG
jgi:hypothetical protein